MGDISKLIRLEMFVLRKDPKVRIKLMISFFLIIYVLSFALFETKANILPFFYFGFFFASPLIDYSYYVERLNRRFTLLLGKGFTLRRIIVAKSLVIFFSGLVSGTLFAVLAMWLSNTGFLNAEPPEHLFRYLFVIMLYNYFIIIFSGIIQTRFEIILRIRLLNILGFIFFVNFQDRIADQYLNYYYGAQLAALLMIISASVYIAGKLNKDKIS